MNPFLLMYYVVTNKVTEAEKMGRDSLTHTLRLLQVSIVIPAILLVIGIIADSKVTIVVSGVLNVVLLLLFTLWADILANIFVLAAGIGHSVVEKIPKVELEKAQKFIRWLRGITMWVSLVWFYAMTFDVRANIGMFLMAITAALITAGIASTRQWNGKLFWAAYSSWALLTFVYCTVALASPETVERVRGAAAFNMAKLRSFHERDEQLGAVEQEASKGAVKIDEILLGKKLARKEEIKLEGVEKCSGRICPKQMKEYLDLVEDISRLKAGTYWPAEPVQEVGEAQATPGPDSAQNADVASQAAPEVKKVDVGDKGKGQPKPDAPSAEVEAQPEPDEDVYSELSKYVE